ncbi:MAG: ribosomal protein S18-alanine N-acetyltransferase [Firmicutes bacterium]|jgi:ribosomal-protein-alanine N-acetyltransferase|nr:ribosomal protein S18-alanine N-acetyltransferase [Bacillota bacterium]
MGRFEFDIHDVQIRPMEVSDLDTVMHIEESVFVFPWQRRGFEAEILRNEFARYFVASIHGRLIGYAGIWIVLDQAHLTTLAVDRTCQCRGVGTLLMKHLLSRAAFEGTVRMSLEVRPSNRSARMLYRRFGFVALGRRKHYYRDEDAIVMVNEHVGDRARL